MCVCVVKSSSPTSLLWLLFRNVISRISRFQLPFIDAIAYIPLNLVKSVEVITWKRPWLCERKIAVTWNSQSMTKYYFYFIFHIILVLRTWTNFINERKRTMSIVAQSEMNKDNFSVCCRLTREKKYLFFQSKWRLSKVHRRRFFARFAWTIYISI